MVHQLVSFGVNSIWEHSLLDPSHNKQAKKKPTAKDPIQSVFTNCIHLHAELRDKLICESVWYELVTDRLRFIITYASVNNKFKQISEHHMLSCSLSL